MWRRLTTMVFMFCVATLPQLGHSQDEAGLEFFHARIEPILKQHCYKCHSSSAESVEAELRLDSRAFILSGGESGPAFDSKRPLNSLLLQAIRHESGIEMPPDQPRLGKPILEAFEQWARLGLPMPASPDKPSADSSSANWSKAKEHWAFQPIPSVDAPNVEDKSWPINPIDAFVLRRLESRKWKPSLEATRSEWIRRVYFDLTGLPPNIEEVREFIDDPSTEAYERVVDRLLASPRYGEKWAQHWLDLVRYAESEGYEYDRHLPGAWRYRDYVVKALNADKPYSEFVADQLAGDEIADELISTDGSASNGSTTHGELAVDRRSAAIFHRLGPVRRNAGNPEIALSRNEVLTE